MSEDERREVERAMMRRALGYETEECVEEYAPEGEGGIPVLVKRRITKKEVAGDVSAAKLLLAPEPGGSDGAAEQMSDEELLSLCRKLIKQLKR